MLLTRSALLLESTLLSRAYRRLSGPTLESARREREVMALVVRGLLDKQVALEPGNSEITVKQHRGQVMHKMRAGSLADPVRMSEKSDLGAAK